eukprot:c11074_g1_i3.p1 GENE.c11074_g1_i3~~c11074_g1_i3.p1  ORF type:complete len:636 (-),score=146.99 c11074_g1_i3:226-2133(-)
MGDTPVQGMWEVVLVCSKEELSSDFSSTDLEHLCALLETNHNISCKDLDGSEGDFNHRVALVTQTYISKLNSFHAELLKHKVPLAFVVLSSYIRDYRPFTPVASMFQRGVEFVAVSTSLSGCPVYFDNVAIQIASAIARLLCLSKAATLEDLPKFNLGLSSVEWCFELGNECAYRNPKDIIHNQGASWYQVAANLGHPGAQNELGLLYFHGTAGIASPDFSLALHYFRLAADQNHPVAQANLAMMYENSKGIERNFTIALEWFMKAAAQGHAGAQNSVGDLLLNNEGVDKPDLESALQYFTSAAKQGLAVARVNVALMHDNGQGTPVDHNHSQYWNNLALVVEKQSNPKMQGQIIAMHYNPTTDHIHAQQRYIRRAEERGDARAMYLLGYLYDFGRGIQQHIPTAAHWYRRGADAGNSHAQCNLGYAYNHGEGVQLDLEISAFWYQQSAEQGNAYGQSNLGNMFYDGSGVPKDDRLAVHWYLKSVAQNHHAAQRNLGHAHLTGRGVEQSFGKAVECYRQAAEHGDFSAQRQMAILHRDGNGVEQSFVLAQYWLKQFTGAGEKSSSIRRGVEAALWYTKAADMGSSRGQHRLGKIFQKGAMGIARDPRKSFALFSKSAAQNHSEAQRELAAVRHVM